AQPDNTIANAGADQVVAESVVVTLTGAGSTDPDNLASPSANLLYAWSQLSGPVVTLSATSTVAPTFTTPTISSASDTAQMVFQLVVSSTSSGPRTSLPDTVSVVIARKPVATSLTVTTNEDTPKDITLSATNPASAS